MTPGEAIQRALNTETAKPPALRDGAYINGLQRAKRCLHDLPALVRHIRDQVPEEDHELKALLTRALIQGCDT